MFHFATLFFSNKLRRPTTHKSHSLPKRVHRLVGEAQKVLPRTLDRCPVLSGTQAPLLAPMGRAGGFSDFVPGKHRVDESTVCRDVDELRGNNLIVFASYAVPQMEMTRTYLICFNVVDHSLREQYPHCCINSPTYVVSRIRQNRRRYALRQRRRWNLTKPEPAIFFGAADSPSLLPGSSLSWTRRTLSASNTRGVMGVRLL